MAEWTAAPYELLATLDEAGHRRAMIGTDPDTGEIFASHPLLAPLADAIAADTRDFAGHAGCFFEVGDESGHLLCAFVHRTQRGQGAGGVRLWTYPTLEALIRDGLRLSRAMGQKCALAGLWWGGGKGVIARRDDCDYGDEAVRAAVFRDYGRFISGLCGCYVTAEDVGTRPRDMEWIFSTTRHTTCIPPALGGSGNPGVLTARGVVIAMAAALAHLGAGTLEGKRIAMQGLGNVSTHMIGELLGRGVARITACDIDAAAVEAVRGHFEDGRLALHVAAAGDDGILAAECDVLVPNAVGEVLTPRTIPDVRAAVVCGAANNQLQDPQRDAALLQERGILFVPDFLANRMGIVNCANEQHGVFPDDPAVERHLSLDHPEGVHRRLLTVLEAAGGSGRTPVDEAQRLADALAGEANPIWGDRGRQIIAYLRASGWASQ